MHSEKHVQEGFTALFQHPKKSVVEIEKCSFHRAKQLSSNFHNRIHRKYQHIKLYLCKQNKQ